MKYWIAPLFALVFIAGCTQQAPIPQTSDDPLTPDEKKIIMGTLFVPMPSESNIISAEKIDIEGVWKGGNRVEYLWTNESVIVAKKGGCSGPYCEIWRCVSVSEVNRYLIDERCYDLDIWELDRDSGRARCLPEFVHKEGDREVLVLHYKSTRMAGSHNTSTDHVC